MSRSVLIQIQNVFNDLLNAFRHIRIASRSGIPSRESLALIWQGLQFAERRDSPQTVTENYWNHMSSTRVMSSHRWFQLFLIAILRVEKIIADEQQDNMSLFQVVRNLFPEIHPGANCSIIPDNCRVCSPE